VSVLDLISNDPFQLVLPFRVVQISGRYGGGKTALAVHWSRRLSQEGYIAYVCANIPLALPVVAEYVERPRNLSYTCYIVDESWQYLALDASAAAIKKELAYLRKYGNYMLLPSVIPLTKHISSFPSVSFVFSFSRLFNLHWWVYYWQVGTGRRSINGYWWWMNPNSVWGLYDSSYIPVDKWWVYDITEWRGTGLQDWCKVKGVDYERVAL